MYCTMIFKVIFSLILALTICLPARADLDKFLEPKQGKEGYQERCFAKYVLRNAIIRYSGEGVAEGLKSDLRELEAILENEERGYYYDCSAYSECNDLRQFALPSRSDPDKFFNKLCNRYVKFAFLCMYNDDTTHRDQLCELQKKYAEAFKKVNRECPRGIIDASEEEAESMMSNTAEELAYAIKASTGEFEADNAKLKVETDKAYKSINNIWAEKLPEFKECWERVEQARTDEKPEKMTEEKQVVVDEIKADNTEIKKVGEKHLDERRDEMRAREATEEKSPKKEKTKKRNRFLSAFCLN